MSQDRWKWADSPAVKVDYEVIADPSVESKDDGTAFVMRMYRKDRPGWCRETIIWSDGLESVHEWWDEEPKEAAPERQD